MNCHPDTGRSIAKPLPMDIKFTTEKLAKQPKDRNAGTHWILRTTTKSMNHQQNTNSKRKERKATTKDPLKPSSCSLRHYK